MSRSRRARALLFWLAGISVVCLLVVGAGLWAVNAFKPPPPPLSTGCTAVVGNDKYSLASDQAANAGLITSIAVRRGLPARAASIALAVALQESKLRNITHGDMDSLGLFQQRPSQDWGTAAQILDPVYSTNAFYNALTAIPGYETLPITDAAQRVQRSAYPDAYAQREPQGKAFASALTGQSRAALACTLENTTTPGSPGAVAAALKLGYGPVGSTAEGNTLRIPASGEAAWSYAQWAVANADALHITEVALDGEHWVRADNNGSTNAGWQSQPGASGGTGTAGTDQTVVVTVQAAGS